MTDETPLKSAEALHDEGKQLFGAGDFSGAERCFSLAIGAAPPVPGDVVRTEFLRKVASNRGRARHNLAMYQEAISDFCCASIFAVKQDDKCNLQRLAHESANQMLLTRLGASGKDSAFDALARLPMDDAHQIVQTIRLACSSFTTSFLIDEAAEFVEKRYAAALEARSSDLPKRKHLWSDPSNKSDQSAYDLIRGGKIAQAVIRFPREPQGWVNLGIMLKTGDEVPINGTKYTNRMCYEKALQLDVRDANGWTNLGNTLFGNDEATICGQQFSSRKCHFTALEINSRCSSAWNNLGITLTHAEEARINGQWYNKRGCYLRCLEIDDECSMAWNNFGFLMARREEGVVRGQRYSRLQCLVRALELDHTNAKAWNNLGNTLLPEDDVAVKDARFTKRQCYLQALCFDPKDPDAWNNLGNLLVADEEIAFKGQKYSKAQCKAKAKEFQFREGVDTVGLRPPSDDEDESEDEDAHKSAEHKGTPTIHTGA